MTSLPAESTSIERQSRRKPNHNWKASEETIWKFRCPAWITRRCVDIMFVRSQTRSILDMRYYNTILFLHPLHCAIRNDDVILPRQYLEQDATLCDQDECGRPLLGVALEHYAGRTAQFLLDHGAAKSEWPQYEVLRTTIIAYDGQYGFHGGLLGLRKFLDYWTTVSKSIEILDCDEFRDTRDFTIFTALPTWLSSISQMTISHPFNWPRALRLSLAR